MLLTCLCNEPSVRPYIGAGTHWVSMDHVERDPRAHVFGNSDGGILLLINQFNNAEWHWLMSERRRGHKCLGLAREAIEFAFTTLKVNVICGATPRENRAARFMNRALGARPVGTTVDSNGRDCIVYMLERDQWATFSKLSAASPAARSADQPAQPSAQD